MVPQGGGSGTHFIFISVDFRGGSDGKESAVWETWVRSLGRKDSLEEGMAPHSSILAWRIPKDRGTSWARRPQLTSLL